MVNPNVPPVEEVDVTGVSVEPATSTGNSGESGSRQLTAIIEPPNADNTNTTYSISPVVEGLTISETGEITWSEDTPDGEYITTVTTDDGGFTATHTLTIE